MASLRVKYDRSKSPPERDNAENRNVLNGLGGRRGGDPTNHQVLEHIYSRNEPADVSALQARKEIEHKQVLKLANTEIEELKASLNYAEHLLAKTMQEKEGVEDQRRQQAYQLEDLGTQLM